MKDKRWRDKVIDRMTVKDFSEDAQIEYIDFYIGKIRLRLVSGYGDDRDEQVILMIRHILDMRDALLDIYEGSEPESRHIAGEVLRQIRSKE